MKKIIIRNRTHISPFNEPARDLRVMNKPLWLFQRDVLSAYCREELECNSLEEIPAFPPQILAGELLIYRDNLFFDAPLIETFITAARETGRAAQIAFSPEDKAIVAHALPLQDGIRMENDLYVADLFYYPDGTYFSSTKPQPLVVDTECKEMGYYRVPTYMANERGDLGFKVPLRSFLSIEHWVHIFMANCPFGIFAHGARVETSLDHFPTMLKVLWRSLLERKQFLSSSALVIVGKNTQIDPAAVIQGPTIIGDNVTIGPGSVINASVIGNNVNIMQGVQLLLSVVGDGSYLGFRAALFMTSLMENSMVAQNTCLQLSVVGRHTFIGAGNTFTDFNIMGNPVNNPVKVFHKGELHEVGLPVIGGCVGHNCRIGSGHIVFPARSIDSDVVLFARQDRTIITKNVSYAESDHHQYPGAGHVAMYHDDTESEQESEPVSEKELVNTSGWE